jgi:hypothetical protein
VAGATVAPTLPEALAGLARDLRPDDVVLVTGSCFTVADALWHLGFGDLDETRRERAAAGVLAPLVRD